MTWLFVQYLSFNSNEYLPIGNNILPTSVQNFAKVLNEPLRNGQMLLELCQSGEISPNQVTLILWHMKAEETNLKFFATAIESALGTLNKNEIFKWSSLSKRG